MIKSGRMCDILFDDEDMPHGYVTIYADAGMKDTIVSVEGVRSCYKNIDDFTYNAYLDPRYDPEFVRTNIRIAITGENKPIPAPEPEPAPKLDAEKVVELIDTITNEAFCWGYHTAESSDARRQDKGVVVGIYEKLGAHAQARCTDARIELRKMLSAEEE